jgi:hypothetical protein
MRRGRILIMLLLLLLLLFEGVVTDKFILPVDLSRTGAVYTGSVYVGNPLTRYKVLITSEHGRFGLTEDLQLTSSTFSFGTDILYLQSRFFRVKIEHINESVKCEDCVGYLGLGSGSLFWKIWRSATISAGSIVFSDDEIQRENRIKCNYLSTGICDTVGYVLDIRLDVKFDFSSDTTEVPYWIYDMITKEVDHSSAFTLQKKWKSPYIEFDSNNKVYLSKYMFIRQTNNGKMYWSIRRGDMNNTIRLGTPLLLNHLIYRNWGDGN